MDRNNRLGTVQGDSLSRSHAERGGEKFKIYLMHLVTFSLVPAKAVGLLYDQGALFSPAVFHDHR